MATLALSLAGQVVGGLVGGPFGAMVGRALGALAGSAVDGMLFGEDRQGTVSDIRLQGSSEGGAVPRLYGWSRLSGNIIWARELELLSGDNAGAKGFGQDDDEDVIGASFAVAFCEGEVHRLGRIWADGQPLDPTGLTLRFYRGTEDQLPDGLIEATQGVAPAYRGLCYLVVEQLPLNRFGNRIPHLSVELCRAVGDLERDITAVTIIPGATEFGYDPVPRVRLAGPGQTVGENTHVYPGVSNWTISIDELMALCPNLEHVALVVSWFGDDLRCDSCAVGPRVEAWGREVLDVEWQVAGLAREDVPVVSSHGGGPAYGGTPSDHAVRAAIADLKARGLGVTLYPLIMMDIPTDNALDDPYGGAAQAPYPWRGRVTCHPAPGQEGSPDQTSTAATQVASFAAQYRGMVLHYAELAADAGGVDMLVIGSEMVGLTTVRGSGNSFPFVSSLVSLAAEVRAIIGDETTFTYAADWSEYSGYQPGGGAKFFHLDPLWASDDIDAVGIDNYMPLADWRDGYGHADAAVSPAGYDADYLAANIAGGEGYDWYYASHADRHAQVRTPITDGAHDEPWIWRYKDLRNWWSNAHHDRPGGVRDASPTDWVPGSKPILFTELGCGAVDKGGNQPNIFGDPKSSESGRPYFSTGMPDPLIQRQVLRAQLDWWRDPANNPVGMVDADRIYLWTWDARPYPAFPARDDVWADGPNHRNGHWLTGRLGGLSSDELARMVAADHGVALTADPAAPFVTGLVLSTPTTAREPLEPLMEATGLTLRNRLGGLHLGAARRSEAIVLDPQVLAEGEGPILSRRRGDAAERPGRLALTYLDRERDYLTGTVTAITDRGGPLVGETTALTLDGSSARRAAERMLDSRSCDRETLDFDLPPSMLAPEPGDLLDIAGLAEGPFEITEVRDNLTRRVTARTLPSGTALATGIELSMPGPSGATVRSIPHVVVAQLPPVPGDPQQSRLVVGTFAQPWPGSVQMVDESTGVTALTLTRRASLGFLGEPLFSGATGVWDRRNAIEVSLLSGHLASVTDSAVLSGSNRMAICGDHGEWEVIGFAQAELTAPGRYRLTRLLRGLEGTRPVSAAAGREVMVLDNRVLSLPLDAAQLGEARAFRVFAGPGDLDGVASAVTTNSMPARPLAPVHLRARRMENGNIAMSWVRRSRADSDGWGTVDAPLEHHPQAYRVSIFDDGVAVRHFEVGVPTALYSTDDQLADFGVPPSEFSFAVAQLSTVVGEGHVAQEKFR
jgi:hypothetical protein